MSYNREQAVAYAHEWAYGRNRRYMDFSDMGGDCTNFISQCLLAGGAKMNYKMTFGWYYNSASDRTPSWTGVNFLYDFLLSNKGGGPFAHETDVTQMQVGDVIQLAFVPNHFVHSLLVIDVGDGPSLTEILIATHTDDSDYRPLSDYPAVQYRFLKIDVR